MLSKASADALWLRKSGKQKARTLSVRAFVFNRRKVAGLSDDLGSLRDDRDGDRSKQSEGGGDTCNFGHLNFPQVVQCLLTMRCRRLRVWMRRGAFFRSICASLLLQMRKRKARSLSSALWGFVADMGALSDDLRSLHQGGHRHRREQGDCESKSGGLEDCNLGHLIPSSV